MPAATYHVTRVQRPGVCPSGIRHAPRAPSPAAGVTRCSVTSSVTSEGVTPPSSLILAHAPDQIPPDDFSFMPYTTGPYRLLPAPAGRWPFPTLSLHSLHSRLVPYPVVSLRCMYPFLHEERRPRNRVYVLGTLKVPDSIFRRGSYFGAANIPSCSGYCARSTLWMPPPCGPLPDKAAGPYTPRSYRAVNPTPNCGITTYPNRRCAVATIGTAGPSPAGMQSCRLLKTP